ncbi:hypothetical protein MKK69_12295, partial [Methylobacterium sp. J-026]|uniref:hypothetical protein n=1 Tax=Methylobacterium sp. J-026 TaxID=2836624 RepID=UPI001FBA484D
CRYGALAWTAPGRVRGGTVHSNVDPGAPQAGPLLKDADPVLADHPLKVKHGRVILLTQSGVRSGKRGNNLFVEQNVKASLR